MNCANLLIFDRHQLRWPLMRISVAQEQLVIRVSNPRGVREASGGATPIVGLRRIA
jgi:hypothetical protein